MTIVGNKETNLKVSLHVKCPILIQNSHIFITHESLRSWCCSYL